MLWRIVWNGSLKGLIFTPFYSLCTKYKSINLLWLTIKFSVRVTVRKRRFNVFRFEWYVVKWKHVRDSQVLLNTWLMQFQKVYYSGSKHFTMLGSVEGWDFTAFTSSHVWTIRKLRALPRYAHVKVRKLCKTLIREKYITRTVLQWNII